MSEWREIELIHLPFIIVVAEKHTLRLETLTVPLQIAKAQVTPQAANVILSAIAQSKKLRRDDALTTGRA